MSKNEANSLSGVRDLFTTNIWEYLKIAADVEVELGIEKVSFVFIVCQL